MTTYDCGCSSGMHKRAILFGAGEITVSTELLSRKQAVPLEETIKKLLFNMIQDWLLRRKTKT